MPKSIFSKLITMFIAVILFSFTIAGFALYYTFGVYVSEEKVKSLEANGDEISRYMEIYLENQSNTAAIMLNYVLNSYRQNTGAYIWVVNEEGVIVFSSPETKHTAREITANLVLDQGYYSFPDERMYKRIFTGTELVVVEKGDFYGLFKNTGWSWLVVQKPVKYEVPKEGSKVVAAIVLSTPINEIHKTRSSVYRFFVVSTMISIIISIMLVYVFSRKITNPLKDIRDAVRDISDGEFEKRLTPKSKDEIGELAASFNQMASALENLEQMRRGFIANVSHELRTPMTSIGGFVEGILDGTIPEDRQKEYLEIVRNEITRLSKLVSDLLDLARMESGQSPVKFSVFDINELIRRTIIRMENIITEKNLEVAVNFESEALVYADPDSIERVLINLAHNGVKFTPRGGIIGFGTRITDEKVIIYVEDTGSGIPEGEIDRIWDRFYKADASRSQSIPGTGLGLSIVKNILNEHKEKIWIESEEGKGTTFYFTLKRAEESL